MGNCFGVIRFFARILDYKRNNYYSELFFDLKYSDGDRVFLEIWRNLGMLPDNEFIHSFVRLLIVYLFDEEDQIKLENELDILEKGDLHKDERENELRRIDKEIRSKKRKIYLKYIEKRMSRYYQ